MELKDCPFCGSKAELIESIRPWISCTNKDCYPTRGDNRGLVTKQMVIDEWNKRVEPKT